MSRFSFLFSFAIISSFFLCYAFVLNTDNKSIQSFNKKFKQRVLERIKVDNGLKQFRSSGKLEVIPVCEFNPDLISSSDDATLIRGLRIDSASSYCVIQGHNSKVMGTVHNYQVLSYSLEKLGGSDLWEVKMFQKALREYSESPFLISFSDLDTNRVVCFFNNGDLNFIDRKMQVIRSSREIIMQQNGTTEKFLENMKSQSTQFTLLETIKTPSEAREFLRNDYIEYSSFFPKDTARVIELLIEEIQRDSTVNNLQVEIIRRQIHINMSKNYLMPFTGSGVPFFGLDIGRCLEVVLTDEQHNTFVVNRRRRAWMKVRASDRIYKYLLIDKKIAQDQVLIEFEKYVFGG